MTTKTERFIDELETARFVQQVARERYNAEMTIEQAHACWAEHSDDYCANWLKLDAERPNGEACQAITKFQERHGKLPSAPSSDDPHASEVFALHRKRQGLS